MGYLFYGQKFAGAKNLRKPISDRRFELRGSPERDVGVS